MVDWRSTVVFCAVFFLLLFNFSFQQLVPLRSRVERLALIQLRSSLGLRARDWPIRDDPCLAWAGIECRNGRVVGINISGFRRTRIGSRNPQFAVDSLSNFTLLESFNASRFALPGSIPDWFGLRLLALQVLDLSSCSIFGAIPSSLGNLTNLTALYLSDNRLEGIVPRNLDQLSPISIVDLSRNSLNGSISWSFTNLGNLTLLDMSSNFFSGVIPPAIGTLSNLQFFNLSRNNLSSRIPAELGDLSRLIELDLSFNSLAGPLPLDLRGLRNLLRMDLGNNFLTGPFPGNLFPPLTPLQSLSLNHNNFNGDLPFSIWSMPQLQFLDASANNFSGELPDLSVNNSIGSVVLNLSSNMFYGALTPIIWRFSVIDLSSNYFQGTVPDNDRVNISLYQNCLQNVSIQRTMRECASFYAGRGLIFDDFGLRPSDPPPPSIRDNERNSRRTTIILASVLGSFGFILIVGVVLVLVTVFGRRKDAANQRGITSVGPVPVNPSLPSPEVALNIFGFGEAFTYQQILQATGDFSDANFIKHGHSGDLYRGTLEGGIHVVVKRIDLCSFKKEDYMSELNFFSRVSHTRLVPLLGHCLANENEKFLIYRYMPNRDLSSSLFRKNKLKDGSLLSLDWITRLKIATGAAEALSYLHHECFPPLVHRDVQASSILLDDKFEVRLGSLNEVCAQEAHTQSRGITRLLRFQQTSDQEFSGSAATTTATCAHDVYSFGKVLFELITGKLGLSSSNESTIKNFLEETLPNITLYDKDLITNIVDPSLLIDDDLLEEVWAMAIVARSCLNARPSRRPLMRYILKALENPLKVVREENFSSGRLKTSSSSRRSWSGSVFGSRRGGSLDGVGCEQI